ncbi:EF-hand domain-containing protein [Brevundimonas sp. FT23028]|uniref:EF-hand domain-containing protein n=1 Tax=Brevundimonas sp. FT23028 TaxID=3393748 RepID=UPI003B589FDA
MRKTLVIGGVAALTLAAATGVALAQQPAPHAGERHAARGDADGDGRIGRAEFLSRLDRLTAADANGDGAVSRDEMRAQAVARRQAGAEARFARLDANHDGALSREEFMAREARQGRPDGARGGHGRHGARKAGFERRGDGERGPVQIAEARTRMEQAFTRLDTDNDGFLTEAERRAGASQAREHRRERMMARRAAQQASPPATASE